MVSTTRALLKFLYPRSTVGSRLSKIGRTTSSLIARKLVYKKPNRRTLRRAGVRSKVVPEPLSACVCASLTCVMAHSVLNDVLCS